MFSPESLAGHAYALVIIFMLLCICLGVTAMHIANKEIWRTLQKIVEGLQATLDKSELETTRTREILGKHIDNQAALIIALHEIVVNMCAKEPLLPSKRKPTDQSNST
jgi:hypothetical protein